jgi:hypothetical protein
MDEYLEKRVIKTLSVVNSVCFHTGKTTRKSVLQRHHMELQRSNLTSGDVYRIVNFGQRRRRLTCDLQGYLKGPHVSHTCGRTVNSPCDHTCGRNCVQDTRGTVPYLWS